MSFNESNTRVITRIIIEKHYKLGSTSSLEKCMERLDDYMTSACDGPVPFHPCEIRLDLLGTQMYVFSQLSAGPRSVLCKALEHELGQAFLVKDSGHAGISSLFLAWCVSSDQLLAKLGVLSGARRARGACHAQVDAKDGLAYLAVGLTLMLP